MQIILLDSTNDPPDQSYRGTTKLVQSQARYFTYIVVGLWRLLSKVSNFIWRIKAKLMRKATVKESIIFRFDRKTQVQVEKRSNSRGQIQMRKHASGKHRIMSSEHQIMSSEGNSNCVTNKMGVAQVRRLELLGKKTEWGQTIYENSAETRVKVWGMITICDKETLMD